MPNKCLLNFHASKAVEYKAYLGRNLILDVTFWDRALWGMKLWFARQTSLRRFFSLALVNY